MNKSNKIFKRLKRKLFYRKADGIKTISWDNVPENEKQKLINDAYQFLAIGNGIEFENYCDKQIKKDFPTSNIEYTYDILSPRGDTFGLAGSISVEDALNLTNTNLSDLEETVFYELLGEHTHNVAININNIYQEARFTDNMINISDMYYEDYVIDVLEDKFNEDEVKNFNVNSFCNKIENLEDELKEKIEDYCDKMYEKAYEYVVEDEEDVIEFIIKNGYTIAIDGEEYQIIR